MQKEIAEINSTSLTMNPVKQSTKQSTPVVAKDAHKGLDGTAKSTPVAIKRDKTEKSEGSFGCDFRNRLNKIPMGEAINLGYKCKKCPKYYWGKTNGEKHESKCTGKKSFEQIDNENNRLLWRPS